MDVRCKKNLLHIDCGELPQPFPKDGDGSNMKPRLVSSVGKGANNSATDVKLVQALLNIYLRRESKKTLPITGKCDPETLSAIENFQKNEQKIPKPDGRIDASGRSFISLRAVQEGVLKDNQPLLKPAEGVVTFDSEGTEGGLYHSRILHVPTETSGLTLGRGYDMKHKVSTKISADLIKAGANAKQSLLVGNAGGKQGTVARQFIIDNDLLDFQITPLAQKGLFAITYADETAEAKRVCTLKRVEDVYGKCKWDDLDYRIRETVVDLKYRGDYTEETRKLIQAHIVKNDFEKFKTVMSDKGKWATVPTDRFDRRKKFLMDAEKKI